MSIIELTRPAVAPDEDAAAGADDQLLSPAEFARRCDIGRTQAYELLRANWPRGPRTLHLGANVKVRVGAVREWLIYLEREGAGQA